MNDFYVAAIDLGSHKNVGAVAKKSDSGTDILYIEKEPSDGNAIYKGKITDKEKMAYQIRTMIQKLENATNIKDINQCYVTFQGCNYNPEQKEWIKKKFQSKKINIIFPSISNTGIIANKFASENERDKGCLIIDFGHSSIGFSFIDNGEITFERVIPAGSKHITMDLQDKFNYDFNLAETLKIKLGKAFHSSETDKLIDLGKNKTIRLSELSEIISSRVDDLFKYILEPIQKNHWNSNLEHTIIITGGGSMLQQMEKYIHNHTGLNTRIVKVEETSFNGPQYAALVSLIEFANSPCNIPVEKTDSKLRQAFNKFIKKGTDTTGKLFDIKDEEEFETKK
ncbi:MAG: rod shape-determining protein [Paludibacteraceae bacterium]|nr:rod shape-determining protein [Paludibacteraceae bacterium]